MTRPIISLGLSTLLVLFSCAAGCAQRREAKEQIRREFTLTGAAGGSTLALYNIFGSVTVQGYAGNQVVVEATRTISAPDAAALAGGQREAQLGFTQSGDSVVVYLAAPYDSRPHRPDGQRGNWGHRDVAYDYRYDFVVRVPQQLGLHVSTVNDGTVRVQDVSGPLRLHNVNGAITMQNVRGTTEAFTVNGNVEASYAAPPPGASSYRTINGQIKVEYPASLGADLHFKSMHGEMFTDFPNPEILPVQVTKNQQGGGSGTVYKLTKDTAVRIGRGGPDMRFETLNGDVIITKRK